MPSVTMPLEAYLQREEKYELLLMKNHPVKVSKEVSHGSEEGQVSPASSILSEWEVIDRPSSTDILETTESRKHPLRPTSIEDEPPVWHLDSDSPESVDAVSTEVNIDHVTPSEDSAGASNLSLSMEDITASGPLDADPQLVLDEQELSDIQNFVRHRRCVLIVPRCLND